MVCLQQARTDFPTSSFIFVSASMTIAAEFAASSLIPYMLLNNSPRQPGLACSSGNSAYTRLLDGDGGVASSDVNEHGCLLSVIIKLIMRRTAANFFLCCETAASWQHCIDYNTISARLAGLRTHSGLLEQSHCNTPSLSPYLSQNISATAVSCKLWFMWS